MRYVIAVGANLGDPTTAVTDALDTVAVTLDGTLVSRSSLYCTEPVGGPDQPEYVNAVVIVESDLAPGDVLSRLQSMEHQAGRVRDVRWGPRTLDLDVIVAGELVSEGPDLTIPHPRAHQRAFVLVPWFEIDPDAHLPGRGPIRDLIDAGFQDQGIEVQAR